MRGSAANQPINLSRRVRYSLSMAVTGSRDPVNACTAAFCEIDATFDVECPCSVLAAATISLGPRIQPQRHPVIEYAFDAEHANSARSRILSVSTFTRLCGTFS